MIGLFLGDTDFPQIVLSKIKKLKKKYFIIDFSKNSKFKKNIYSHRISIGKFGKILNLIKEKKSKKVLFAGKIAKPKFSSLNLTDNGKIFFKFFNGLESETIIQYVKKNFSTHRILKPDSSRKASKEVYMLCSC